MGQEYLPGRIGVASGVTIGLSIGLGGIGAPLLGLVADAHGLRAVFELLVVFPLLAMGLAQLLPSRPPTGYGEEQTAAAPIPGQKAGKKLSAA